jgi:hypothetical protein
VLNEQLKDFSRAELDTLTSLLARLIANVPAGAASAACEVGEEDSA